MMRRFVGLDPASTTGFVALDEKGAVLRDKELTGIGKDARKMMNLHDEILSHLYADDKIAIEDFALAADDINKVASGCNWSARLAAERAAGGFVKVGTSQLKNFVNVSEWVGVPGKKTRLKSDVVKKLVMAAVTDHWGYVPQTNNIADAFVLAQISYALNMEPLRRTLLPPYQIEVLNELLKPADVKKAEKAEAKKKKDERAAAKALGKPTTKTTRSRAQKPVGGVLF